MFILLRKNETYHPFGGLNPQRPSFTIFIGMLYASSYHIGPRYIHILQY